MIPLLLFLAWAGLFMWAVYSGCRSRKPRQFPWLTNKKGPARTGPELPRPEEGRTNEY